MFLVKYYRDSWNFKELLVVKQRPFYKIIIYFIIMIIVATFPMTLDAIRHDGSRLDFIIEDFSNGGPTVPWNVPMDLEIRAEKLVIADNAEYRFEFKETSYYFIGQEEVVYQNYPNSIIFLKEKIAYVNEDGAYMERTYQPGFGSTTFPLYNLSAPNNSSLYQTLANNIEKSFSDQIIFFTITRNIAVQLFVNVIYIFVLSLLLQVFRFGYTKFISYFDGLKFIIVSLGPPATIAFVVGIFAPAFAQIAFSLVSGLIVMIVPLVFGKKLYS